MGGTGGGGSGDGGGRCGARGGGGSALGRAISMRCIRCVVSFACSFDTGNVPFGGPFFFFMPPMPRFPGSFGGGGGEPRRSFPPPLEGSIILLCTSAAWWGEDDECGEEGWELKPGSAAECEPGPVAPSADPWGKKPSWGER